jgi:hypothetical protein
MICGPTGAIFSENAQLNPASKAVLAQAAITSAHLHPEIQETR